MDVEPDASPRPDEDPLHLADAYAVATHLFPKYNWGSRTNPRQLDMRLPVVLLYLKGHDRGTATKSYTANDLINATRVWLAESVYNDRVTFGAHSNSITQTLGKVVREHGLDFGIVKEESDSRTARYLIQSCGYRALCKDSLGWLPEDCYFGRDQTGGLLLHTTLGGARIQVTIGAPDIAGRGTVLDITFNDLSVKDSAQLNGKNYVEGADDIVKLVGAIGRVRPCRGVCRSHMFEDKDVPLETVAAFGTVVRQALRILEKVPDILQPHDRDRWQHADVRGVLAGPNGHVSGAMGLVGREDVLWSRKCTGFATPSYGRTGVPRCTHCKDFYRRGMTPRTAHAAKHTPAKKTRVSEMSTAQKERQLLLLALEKKKHKAEMARLRARLQQARRECVRISKEQGEALHKLLLSEKTMGVFGKLPKASDQRIFFEDQVRWNTKEGKERGFRYHPQTLRIALYLHGMAGTAAYNLVRQYVHLPSPARVRELQRQASPPRTGILRDNIKKYGRLAAHQDADKADLLGVLTWDLMHLSKNGFNFAPNAGGITGLVDETTFFNPIYQQQMEKGEGLEKTLGRIVANQYVEMFFVSLGRPEYKFVVWREATRSLSTDYIQRMIVSVSRALAIAHVDKGFDVVSTVCDGASEHRSYQEHAASEKFETWSKGETEKPFADFKVGSLHPHHLRPIFNMSDPMHILKKIVNALWHSDITTKQRDLGAWAPGEDGELEFHRFSLKTAERVFNEIEFEGQHLSDNEKSAMLSPFAGASAAIWRRDNHSCMNVSLSAKVVSGMIIDAIADYMEANGRNGAAECYQTLARQMNDFVDIFNGNYGRSKVDRKDGRKKMVGCIRSFESAPMDRLLEILEFFDDWQSTLERKHIPSGEGDKLGWKKHFITHQSWFDLRLSILGFVSMCRYLFEDPERFQIDSLSPNCRRFLSPRNCSQDICEHRFSHIRAALGTHRNPTAREAKKRSAVGDLCRATNGKRRRNASRNPNARSGGDFEEHGDSEKRAIKLAVTKVETGKEVRAWCRNTPAEVLCPRYMDI